MNTTIKHIFRKSLFKVLSKIICYHCPNMQITNFFKSGKEAALLWYEHDADFMAATVSYYALFAVVPMIVLTITLMGFVFGREYVTEVLILWGSVLGTDLIALLTQAVGNLEGLSNGFAWPLFGVIFFSGMTVMAFNSLTSGLHTLWGIPHQGIRGWIKKCIQSILCISVIEVYVLTLFFLHRPENWLFQNSTGLLLVILQISISIVASTILFSLFMRILPWERPSFKARLMGSFVASCLFVIAKILVAIYVTITPVPGLFGTAGVLLVLLIWVYVAVMIFYFGAAVAYFFDQQLAQ